MSNPGSPMEPETYTNTQGYDDGSDILPDTPGRHFNDNYFEPSTKSSENSTSSDEDDSQHPHQAPNKNDRPENLSSEQVTTVESAREAMTSAQRNLVDKRNEHVRPGVRFYEQPAENCGEGASRGKGVDPRNWGAAGIPEEELDPDAQQALIEEYNAFKIFQAARNKDVRDATAKKSAQSKNTKDPVDETDIEEHEGHLSDEERAELKERIKFKKEFERDLR